MMMEKFLSSETNDCQMDFVGVPIGYDVNRCDTVATFYLHEGINTGS